MSLQPQRFFIQHVLYALLSFILSYACQLHAQQRGVSLHNTPTFIRNAGQVRIVGTSTTQSNSTIPLYVASLQYGIIGIRTNGVSFVVQRESTLTRTDIDFDGVYTITTPTVAQQVNYYDTVGTLHRLDATKSIMLRNTTTNQSIEVQLDDAGVRLNATSPLTVTASTSVLHTAGEHIVLDDILRITTPTSFVSHSNPIGLQHTQMQWEMNDTQPAIQISFITPTTSASYFGGSALDSVAATSGDGTSLYVCGVTTSPNFPATAGTHQQSPQGGRDAFVAKFDARGSRIWATYFGGSGDDIATSIITSSTTLALCGTTATKSNFISSGGYKSSFLGGSTDGFICTINPATGQLLNSTYIGGNSIDACTDICIMPNGNIACTGTTFSDNMEANGHQKTQGGVSDVFIIVLNPSLSSLQWSSYYGSDDLEYGGGISVSSNGSLFVCGTTGSYNANNIVSTAIGEGNDLVEFFDAFLVKFSAQGVREWGRYYGGKGYDYANRVIVTSTSVAIIGHTNSGTTPDRFIATADSPQPDYGGGNNDGYIAVFNSESGRRLWGTYQGGSGDDRCTGITATPNGDVFVTGMSNSANFPLFPKDSPAPAGGYDAFMGYYKADGKQRIASVLFGGSGDDRGAGLMRLPDNTILMCGTTTSTNLPVSGGGQQSNAGGSDLFLASFIDYSILDVEDSEQSININIAPNPIGNTVLLRTSSDNVIHTIGIYTILGEEVVHIQTDKSSAEYLLSTAHLSAGTYVIRTTFTNGITMSRMVVKE